MLFTKLNITTISRGASQEEPYSWLNSGDKNIVEVKLTTF